MLIQYLGNDLPPFHQLLTQITAPSTGNQDTVLVIGQQGVFHLKLILDALNSDPENTLSLFPVHVLERDLIASGLLPQFTANDKVKIITFEQFVSLATQFRPCITLQ